MRDRRRYQRQMAAEGPWISAQLRPGRDVVLVDIGEGGARIDAPTRLFPGTEAVLRLRSPDRHLVIRGRVLRCEVISLDPSLGIRYRGAVCFDTRVRGAAGSEQKVAADIQTSIRIPFVHIVDATAEQIKAQGLATIALLGTRFTMEEDFYVGRLTQRYGLQVLIPDTSECAMIHRVIDDELCLGEIKAVSKAQYLAVIDRLIDSGAQGIILGCTEIGLLVQADDCRVPVFDTTRLHAQAAVDLALLV